MTHDRIHRILGSRAALHTTARGTARCAIAVYDILFEDPDVGADLKRRDDGGPARPRAPPLPARAAASSSPR